MGSRPFLGCGGTQIRLYPPEIGDEPSMGCRQEPPGEPAQARAHGTGPGNRQAPETAVETPGHDPFKGVEDPPPPPSAPSARGFAVHGL